MRTYNMKNKIGVIIVDYNSIEKSIDYACRLNKYIGSEDVSFVIVENCQNRLTCALPKDVIDRLYLRIRSNKESFPLAPSGKRNYQELISEGITDKCIKVESVKKLIKNIK